MSQNHKQEHDYHDEHHDDSHEHNGGHSHDDHGGGHSDHDDAHGSHSHGGHDDHKSHGHDKHDDHHEEEPLDPIEPAGIVNDLSFDLEPTIDLTDFFPFSEITTIQDISGKLLNDLWPANRLQKINLSQRLVLSISKSQTHPVLADIYQKSLYKPKIFVFGEIKYAPRFNPIELYEPLPPVQENSIDIRSLPVIANQVTYPDIYHLPVTVSRTIRRIRKQHGRRIFRTSVTIAVIGIFCSISLASMTLLAKREIIAGYGSLTSLSLNAESSEVKAQIQSVHRHFSKASLLFLPMRYLVTLGIIDNETVSNGFHALYAGTAVSELLTEVDSIQSDLVVWYKWTWALTSYMDPKLVLQTNIPLTDYFRSNSDTLLLISKNISQAQYHFSSITTTGNPTQDAELAKLTQVLGTLESAIKYTSVNGDEILNILGDRKPMNYLILNQNRDELRANGGFPGSAVEMTLYKGKLEKYVKKDIYFYDWHLFPYGELPPPGIDQIAKTWGMRDANYSPDIRESFVTMSRMYEKAGGSTLDGMVAIHQGLIEDLLAVTWPVRILGVPDQIDSTSFSVLLSVLVEGQYARQNSAKDILFLAIDEIVKKMAEAKQFDLYMQVAQKNIDANQILVALRDTDNQAFVDQVFGIPKYRNNPNNFVYPVFTSLSWNKSDRYVHRTFDLSRLSQSGCTVTNRFALTSEHLFSAGERENIRSMLYRYGVDVKEHEHELYVQWNGDNVQFIRLLVPKNSSFVGISKELEGQFKWNTEHAEYDEISFNITTGVGKTSQMFVDYASTPNSCRPELQFIEQPGLQRFQVRNQ